MFNKKLRQRIESLEDTLWVAHTTQDGYVDHVLRGYGFMAVVNKFLEDNKKK
jgi:hypothetical protein